MVGSAGNGFFGSVSAKRSAFAADRAASLTAKIAEDAKPEHLALMRHVVLVASQAAERAAATAQAAELAAVAASAAGCAASAVGSDVFSAIKAIALAVGPCQVDVLSLFSSNLYEEMADEAKHVDKLVELATKSAKAAILASEAAANAAETAALIAESARTEVCRHKQPPCLKAVAPMPEAAQYGGPGGSPPCTDICSSESDAQGPPGGQWWSFMSRFTE
ncbi:MAG: hypothetical protein WCO00_07260 [Rhodospirillaceae bacterium]